MTVAGRSDLVDIAGTVVHETAGAILLDAGLEEPVWLPKSAIEDNGDGTWAMRESLAHKKGLI